MNWTWYLKVNEGEIKMDKDWQILGIGFLFGLAIGIAIGLLPSIIWGEWKMSEEFWATMLISLVVMGGVIFIKVLISKPKEKWFQKYMMKKTG